MSSHGAKFLLREDYCCTTDKQYLPESECMEHTGERTNESDDKTGERLTINGLGPSDCVERYAPPQQIWQATNA